MESAAKEKGLERKEQLNALRAQSAYRRRDVIISLPGLKACRLAAGFSQRDLAEMIGQSQTTMAQLETDDIRAPLYLIRRLCRALKVLPADLICEDPVK